MGDDERHSQAGGIFDVIPPLSSSGRSRQVGGVNGGIVSSSGNDLRTNKPRFRRSRLACPAETAYAGHAAVLQPDSRAKRQDRRHYQQINQRKQESDQITADQNRIRENMKALK